MQKSCGGVWIRFYKTVGAGFGLPLFFWSRCARFAPVRASFYVCKGESVTGLYGAFLDVLGGVVKMTAPRHFITVEGAAAVLVGFCVLFVTFWSPGGADRAGRVPFLAFYGSF